MSVQAVNGFQVVNVHKQKSEFGVLVFLEHPVIFFHVVFIAGPGSETAERVHHDLPFQYSRRILQREEEGDRDDRDRAAGEKEFLYLGLDQFGNDQHEQHRQHGFLKMSANPFPVPEDIEDAHCEIGKSDHISRNSRRPGTGFGAVQLDVFNLQHTGNQQDDIDPDRDQHKPSLCEAHLLRAGQIQRIYAHRVGKHNR